MIEYTDLTKGDALDQARLMEPEDIGVLQDGSLVVKIYDRLEKAKVGGSPGGKGWSKIPNGKKGGFRKKKGKGWQYWYPKAAVKAPTAVAKPAKSDGSMSLKERGRQLKAAYKRYGTHLDYSKFLREDKAIRAAWQNQPLKFDPKSELARNTRTAHNALHADLASFDASKEAAKVDRYTPHEQQVLLDAMADWLIDSMSENPDPGRFKKPSEWLPSAFSYIEVNEEWLERAAEAFGASWVGEDPGSNPGIIRTHALDLQRRVEDAMLPKMSPAQREHIEDLRAY